MRLMNIQILGVHVQDVGGILCVFYFGRVGLGHDILFRSVSTRTSSLRLLCLSPPRKKDIKQSVVLFCIPSVPLQWNGWMLNRQRGVWIGMTKESLKKKHELLVFTSFYELRGVCVCRSFGQTFYVWPSTPTLHTIHGTSNMWLFKCSLLKDPFSQKSFFSFLVLYNNVESWIWVWK